MSLTAAQLERISEDQRRANREAIMKGAAENQVHAVARIDRIVQRLDQARPSPLTVTAPHISDIIAKPSRVRWLVRKELERGSIAVIAGKRGSFKSFIAMHWSMRAALAGEPVLIVSAGGSGMDRRALAWIKTHAPGADAQSLPVHCIERRVDFNSVEGIQAVADEIARLEIRPALVVIDT
jgi:hypothetical protein